jgi:GNAT superfamily N-acetyltransferase
MTESRIRPATAADGEAMARFHWEVRRAAFAPSIPLEVLDRKDLPYRRRYWADRLASPDHGTRTFTLILEEPGRGLVGFSGGGPADKVVVRGYRWQLGHIYLAPDGRGRGGGRRLFEEASRWLGRAGADRFFLWTPSGNAGGRGFYEHMGGELLLETATEDAAGTVRLSAYGWTLDPRDER